MPSEPRTNQTDMLSAALANAARGWPVFPCREKTNGGRAKAPYTEHGFKDATTDTAKIKEWWTKWPNAMIGIPTGPDIGFWVLDIDNSHGKDGDATLARLEAENDKIPSTPYQQTARGGKHMLFNWSDGIRNRAAFAPGLDVRGDGGYIIIAPSYWEGEGEYSWIDDPADTWLTDAPAWLIEMIVKHGSAAPTKPAAPYAPKIIANGVENTYYAKVMSENASQVAACPPGSQNETLYTRSVRIGSFVGGGGIDEDFAIAEMTRAGMSMSLGDSHDPWSREVIEDTVKRGIEWGKKSPNVAPERSRPSGKPQLKVVGGQEKPETDNSIFLSPDYDPNAKWKTHLIYKDDSGLKLADKDIGNMRLLMTYHEHFAGHIKLNSFSLDIEIGSVPWREKNAPPRPVKDEDYTHAREWLQRHGMKPSAGETRDALVLAAEFHSYHPVREYLKSLEWDGTCRIHEWLSTYLGVHQDEYAKTISPKVLIGAVARVMNPGCQLDTVLIIEGRQGLKKSSAIQALFSRQWTSEATDLFKQQNKMVMLMMGAWAIELAEFSAVLTAPELVSKGLITTRVDDVVLPYARSRTKHDRQCIMIGTMNPDESGYLTDKTGNRRYWPVFATKIDLAGITQDRDQLWAEAYYEYNQGTPWWLNDEEDKLALDAQSGRQVKDPWAEMLHEKLVGIECIEPIKAMDLLEISNDRRDKRTRDRICAALRDIGFVNKVQREEGKPVRKWRRSD